MWGIALTSSFDPREVVLWSPPLSDTLPQEWTVSPCVLQMFFLSVPPCHLSLGYLPAFYAVIGMCLRTLSHPNMQTFKTPVFKPHWFQILMKTSPSYFPSQWLWERFLLVYNPVCSFLIPFWAPSLLQHLWSISALNQVSGLPTSLSVVSSHLSFYLTFLSQDLGPSDQLHLQRHFHLYQV